MSDQEHSPSEEDINLKFQELKEKVIELKESNKAIQSHLDALFGVGDDEQTFCPLCQRQDEEAVMLKKLQERVKNLEHQKRCKDEEIDKLSKSLYTLIKQCDRLSVVAQAIPFGARSETDITGTEKAISSFNTKNVCGKNVAQVCQNVTQTGQNVTQTSSDKVISTKNYPLRSSAQEEKLGGLSKSGNQSYTNQGTQSEHKSSSAEGKCLLGCDQVPKEKDTAHMLHANNQSSKEKDQESSDLQEQNIPNTKIGSTSEYSDYKLTKKKEVIDRAVGKGEGHNEATKLQKEVNIHTGLPSVVPGNEHSEETVDFVNHFDSLQSVESSIEIKKEQSEERIDFLNHFDSLQSAESSLEVRHDLQPIESTGEKLPSSELGVAEQMKTPVDISQSPDAIFALVSEVHTNWDPEVIKRDNIMLKLQHSSINKDSDTDIVTDLTRGTVQKTEDLHSNSMAEKLVNEDTSERNSIEEMKFLGGVANFTKSSIKNKIFPRKQESSGTTENQYHEPYQEKDDDHDDATVVNKQVPDEGIVDLDLHVPVSRVLKSHWSDLAQKELDEALKRNIRDIHTVLCIDTSASMRQGSAWEQTQQFFSQFIKGLEEVRQEFGVHQEYVALSIFGQEVKVVHRLTNSFIPLQQSFSALKLGGPSPMYGGLLMALAGVAGMSVPSAASIKIQPRIILITDGHPTDPLVSSGPDVYDPDKIEKGHSVVMEAVLNITLRNIYIHCVPVGDADVSFLEWIAATAHGKVFSYKDGRQLARKTINTINAGHLIKHWKMIKVFGTEISLEDVIRQAGVGLGLQFQPVMRIASLSEDEKEEVLEIAKEALDEDLVDESENALQKYHYEFDNPNVKLPPLGTRVRRGPDWDKGLQDENGPGTIIGHHKNQRQVHVEWDKNGKSGFYRYGDIEKYDVITVDEPRLLKLDELITTGCHVRRGIDWKYGSQDGTPGAIGVVVKVLDDGRVVVRWPDKSSNFYRFGANGCFDLEICTPFENQTGLLAQSSYQSTPKSAENLTLKQSSSKSTPKNKNAVSKITPKNNKNA